MADDAVERFEFFSKQSLVLAQYPRLLRNQLLGIREGTDHDLLRSGRLEQFAEYLQFWGDVLVDGERRLKEHERDLYRLNDDIGDMTEFGGFHARTAHEAALILLRRIYDELWRRIDLESYGDCMESQVLADGKPLRFDAQIIVGREGDEAWKTWARRDAAVSYLQSLPDYEPEIDKITVKIKSERMAMLERLDRMANGPIQQTTEGPELREIEANILEALADETLTASQIAPKAGYQNNSRFRETLSGMMKRGILINIRGKGYKRSD